MEYGRKLLKNFVFFLEIFYIKKAFLLALLGTSVNMPYFRDGPPIGPILHGGASEKENSGLFLKVE